MSAATVITKMQSAGLTVRADGGDLVITPPGRLTDQQRDYLKQHKAELLACLLDAGQPGADHQPANDGNRVSVDDLPLRLRAAATRVCLELYNDSPEAVESMLNDLAHYQAESWDKLAEHFMAQLVPDFDNRRTCRQCLNLISAGGCRTAQRGELSTAISTWKPDPERLRRCVAYLPDRDDTDQRTGRERWPGLELVPGISTEAAP